MMFFKFSFRYLLFFSVIIGFVFTSCEEEEDDEVEIPEIDRGHTEANRIQLIFNRVVGGGLTMPEDTAEIYDTDGQGGNAPIILDSLVITRYDINNNPINYEAQIRFFLGNSDVTGIIRDKGFDYNVCYRNFQTEELDLLERDLDVNNVFLGLNTKWRTDVGNTNGINDIRITLNYQPVRKEGLCDAGIRIFDYNLPYRLK